MKNPTDIMVAVTKGDIRDTDPAAMEAARALADVIATPSGALRVAILERIEQEIGETSAPVPAASVILALSVAGFDPFEAEDAIVSGVQLGLIGHGGHSVLTLTERGALALAMSRKARAMTGTRIQTPAAAA
jgi:hypothetical protein